MAGAGPDTSGLSAGQAAVVERALGAGQESPFRFWGRLDAPARARLAGQLSAIDFELLERLVAEHVTGAGARREPGSADVKPAPVERLPATGAQRRAAEGFRRRGEQALAAGRVAVLTVAGGQGTRLGFEGPKGCFPVGPVTGRTLFRHHAEKVLALSRRAGRPVRWLVMTGPANYQATAGYLAAERFFGLAADQVRVFRQGVLPAVDRAGGLILEAPDRLALSPDGHGGTIAALRQAGLLAELAAGGVDTLFYFQVDNPLVAVADPVFVGRHLAAGAEMSIKVVAKRDAAEKVGVAAGRAGRLQVIEYSDLPAELAAARDAGGQLLYWAGSVAIHVFSVEFLARLAAREAPLPYHRAEKAVPCADESGRTVRPAEKNGIKFECFIFDALPEAERALVVETARAAEFAPVKNASGEDSAESCRRMLAAEWARWIESAGGRVPRSPDGGVDGRIEISPLCALDAAELAGKLPRPFGMRPGQDLVLG